jgi:hypothetical protein
MSSDNEETTDADPTNADLVAGCGSFTFFVLAQFSLRDFAVPKSHLATS